MGSMYYQDCRPHFRVTLQNVTDTWRKGVQCTGGSCIIHCQVRGHAPAFHVLNQHHLAWILLSLSTLQFATPPENSGPVKQISIQRIFLFNELTSSRNFLGKQYSISRNLLFCNADSRWLQVLFFCSCMECSWSLSDVC